MYKRTTLFFIAVFALLISSTAGAQGRNTSWLRLNVPGWDPNKNMLAAKGETVFSLSVMTFGRVHCYKDNDPSKGTTHSFSKNTLRFFLQQQNKKPGNYIYVIEGDHHAFYSDLVTLIRLLNETDTKRYVLAGTAQGIQVPFFALPDSLMRAMPQSLPDTIALWPGEAVLLFDFRGDTLCLAKKTAEGIKELAVAPLDRMDALETSMAAAFRELAGTRTRVCIAGDQLTRYASFKTLVDLLRRQNWYRYELLVKPLHYF